MKVSLITFLAAFAVADASSSASSMMAPWGIPRGGAKTSYASKLDAVKEEVLASTLPAVRKIIIIVVVKEKACKSNRKESTIDSHKRFLSTQYNSCRCAPSFVSPIIFASSLLMKFNSVVFQQILTLL